MKSNSAPLTLLLSVIIAAGCGGRESAASKSAAEFDREQQKGGTPPTTGGAHGGHVAGQESPADRAEAKDGDEMAGMDHSKMAGMKPAKGAPPAGGSMAGMDHSNMAGMKPAKGAAPAGGSMAGMDHSNMPGMDHSNMAGTTMAPPLPEKASASAQPGQPAATLNPGALDGPAPTSVRDAARSAELAQAMAGGGHGMTHGTYSQTDAGRTATTAPPPDATDHGKHRQPAPPRPRPAPGAKENNQ